MFSLDGWVLTCHRGLGSRWQLPRLALTEWQQFTYFTVDVDATCKNLANMWTSAFPDLFLITKTVSGKYHSVKAVSVGMKVNWLLRWISCFLMAKDVLFHGSCIYCSFSCDKWKITNSYEVSLTCQSPFSLTCAPFPLFPCQLSDAPLTMLSLSSPGILSPVGQFHRHPPFI